VIYLVIVFVVAAAGIARLWIQQRRERAHLETVDGFRESLESIQPTYSFSPRSERKSRARRPEQAEAPRPVRRAARPIRSAVPRYKPLEPERRAAAKRRLEQRRRARTRAAL
jgi:hypothetical protein